MKITFNKFLIIVLLTVIISLPISGYISYVMAVQNAESTYTTTLPNQWQLNLKDSYFVYKAEGTVTQKDNTWVINDGSKTLTFSNVPSLEVTQINSITAEDVKNWRGTTFDNIKVGDRVIIAYYHLPDNQINIPVAVYLVKK